MKINEQALKEWIRKGFVFERDNQMSEALYVVHENGTRQLANQEHIFDFIKEYIEWQDRENN